MPPAMGDITTAIVWGIPVNPAELLCNLDAFRKAIPTIETLRLCNQFGKGENAGVTKLPKELIGYIEEELLVLLRQEERHADRSWVKRFCCFEGTCRPSDHMDVVDFFNELDEYDEMVEEALITLSKTHSDWHSEDWRTDDGFDLPVDVQKLVDAEIATQFDMWGGELVYDYCFENRHDWVHDVCIRMKSEGHNDVLRKHFGLNIFIMHENLDDATVEYLERTDERYSRSLFEPDKTTICYLVLPPRAAKWDIQLDRDCDEYYGASANSMLIDHNSLDLTEAHQRLFARAMSQLALRPSAHPSQLRTILSTSPSIASSSTKQARSSSTNKSTPAEKKAKKDAMITKRVNALNESQWPKLMCLVNTDCYAY